MPKDNECYEPCGSACAGMTEEEIYEECEGHVGPEPTEPNETQ